MRYLMTAFLIGSLFSYPVVAGVNPEDCIYGKQGGHNVQEREYDKVLVALELETKRSKRKKRKRNRTKGLR